MVLNASDPTLPAFIAIDTATRATLAAPGSHPVEFYSETLDMMRFPEARLEPVMFEVLRAKYADRPLDAIIAVGTAGLDFAERHRQALWPDAYVVFHTIGEDALRSRPLPPKTTGIVAQFDFGGSARIAMRLLPSTRRIVVIGGSSEFDQLMIGIARAQLAPLAREAKVEYWTGRSIEDVAAQVARLPADAIVLYLSMFVDANGRTFIPREVLGRLSAASAVPVFGAFDTYVGGGVVAASVDDYDQLGRSVARLVVEVLSSPRHAAAPPVAAAEAVCVADARELRRWNLSERRLPDGCNIRFAEVSAWQRYRWQIVTGLAIILSQAVLIAALILQRRRRQRAEIATQAVRNELVHAARLASMGELTASIAHEITQPLSAILAHADTAEILLEADAPPIHEIQRIVSEIRRDDLRASAVITRLRDLLGKHAMERHAVDLNEVIADTRRVLDVEARRRGVVIETELASGLPPVAGDRVHLQQVVLNLVLNGMDAMADVAESSRRLVVSTAALADSVEIAVADSGPGIDPAIMPRLFDSFVTSKAHGLGLGLSIVRSIVEAHGGSITAGAGAHGGAIFRIVLPIGAAVRGQDGPHSSAG